MTKTCIPVLLALSALTLVSCDSDRLDQFSTFAAAGSQYVQNFHQLTAETGDSMIATDSAVLLTARRQAGDTFNSRKAEFSTAVKTDNDLLQSYLSVLQKLDAQATLLGSYFAAVTALTNGKPNDQAAAAANTFLDALNAFNPEIEKATIAGQPIKNLMGPATNLIVDHFEVKALEDHLKKAAPTIDQALALQQAAVTAIGAQLASSEGAFLVIRESSDVIDPFIASGSVPADWPDKRVAFLRQKITLTGLSSAESAIKQLRIAFQQLVQVKNSNPDFSTLLSEIGKMRDFTAAVKASANSPNTASTPKTTK